MMYVLLVKCTDGSTRTVRQEAATPDAAKAQAYGHLAYYQGLCIDEVIGIAEDTGVSA